MIRGADHIRARIFVARPRSKRRATLYGLEVINHNTRRVIATDDCTDMARLIDTGREAVEAARLTWFWSFTKRAVR